MKNKAYLILLSALMLIALCACSGSGDKTAKPTVEAQALESGRSIEIELYDDQPDVVKLIDGENEPEEIIELSGTIISYDKIELTQGSYIVFNVANAQGNGSAYFLNCKSAEVEYVIESVIDFHKEGYINAYYAPVELSNDGYGYSYVYADRLLKLEVKDINSDGYLDLVFSGENQLVNDETDEVLHSEKISRKYVYKAKKNAWVEKKKK